MQSHTHANTHTHIRTDQFQKTTFWAQETSNHTNQVKTRHRKFWPNTILPLPDGIRVMEVKITFLGQRTSKCIKQVKTWHRKFWSKTMLSLPDRSRVMEVKMKFNNYCPKWFVVLNEMHRSYSTPTLSQSICWLIWSLSRFWMGNYVFVQKCITFNQDLIWEFPRCKCCFVNSHTLQVAYEKSPASCELWETKRLALWKDMWNGAGL